MLSISGLEKSFRDRRSGGRKLVKAVDGISLEVEAGSLFTLLGPSGCGKTTTLRCIAGLETPDAGEVAVGGRVLYSSLAGVNEPANARGLGMVFQSYAIWPHMSVYDNAAFPLSAVRRRSRPSARDVRVRVERALAVVKLDGLAARPATDLSGGQQQRLALARALVMEPPLLLLDEPLSNLDAPLREEMRLELKRLQQEVGITSVYVTHDQAEALAISSAIAVMRDGRIEQLGRPRDVYLRPATRFVAQFVGAANLLDGHVESRNGAGAYLVRTALGSLTASAERSFSEGDRVTLVLRPEHLTLTSDSSNPNGSRGVVQAQSFLGDAVDHVVRVGELELRARGAPTALYQPGAFVSIRVSIDSCALLPADG